MYKYELKRKNSSLVVETMYLPEPDQNPWEKDLIEGKYVGRGLHTHNSEIFVTEAYEKKQEPEAPKKKPKPSTTKIRQSKNLSGLRKAIADYLDKMNA